MNLVFSIMVLVSIIYSFITGRVDETIQSGFSGAAKSIEIVLSFAGIMCMWSGFLKVAENGGAMRIMTKLIHPLTRILFPKLDKSSNAMQYICANMSANLLGVGNAATPAGIAAMEELDKINKNYKYPSDEMCTLTVMNTASMQLIPSTVITLRVASGSSNPQMIIPAVLITSFASVVCAVTAMKIILRIRKGKRF